MSTELVEKHLVALRRELECRPQAASAIQAEIDRITSTGGITPTDVVEDAEIGRAAPEAVAEPAVDEDVTVDDIDAEELEVEEAVNPVEVETTSGRRGRR